MIRRNFIKKSLLSIPTLTAIPSISFAEKPLKIGLAQWSLHRAFRSKKLNNLDFAKTAKEKFDICLLYTSPSPRDLSTSRMPSSA